MAAVNPEALHFPTRTISLSTSGAARLIRDALGAGGEIWVSGTGTSMHPTIRNSDRVLLAPLRGVVKRGDIVLVPGGRAFTLHRVQLLVGEAAYTQGDARSTVDVATRRSHILARAVAVCSQGGVIPLTATLRFGFLPMMRFVFRELLRHSSRARRSLFPS